ncbi:DUF1294 domain-containing protein [Alteromonas sp. H39]|uniref:DUF1294 domain-containing protein n=1 Tax=Alteromonas sp. H39 TaxID=3389876 RepID=UPI0039E07BD7
MRHQGTLYQWNDDKGYGFVTITGQKKVFVHISAFQRPARRPREGDNIAFHVEVGERQRLQASRIKLMGVKRHASAPRTETKALKKQRRAASLPVLPLIILMVLPVVAWLFPDLRTGAAMLVVLNLVTFVMYWKDKSAARKQQRRVSEANLHIAALLGGWPGAWIAQHILRHKTVKTSFRTIFWLTIVVNIVGILVILRQLSYW